MILLARRNLRRFGRKFRDKSGRLVRYVYRGSKRIGVEIYDAGKRGVKRYISERVYRELKEHERKMKLYR